MYLSRLQWRASSTIFSPIIFRWLTWLRTATARCPFYYKFAALWAGQEGSLLLWTWLLSTYAFFALFVNRNKHPELMPYVGVVLAGVQTFFLTLNNFVASPFAVLAGADPSGVMRVSALADGHGLNPLLQYPEMVIHPPMLYLGYTGFTVPFAFALGALLEGIRAKSGFISLGDGP